MRFQLPWKRSSAQSDANAVSDPSGRIAAHCLRLRQGDLIGVPSYRMTPGRKKVSLPHGAVLISQSCDIVQLQGRPNVVLAAVSLLDERHAAAAREGERPRYVHVPSLGDLFFADLENVFTMPKAALPGLSVRAGIATDDWDSSRRFSLGIGRRFSRMALPDEVFPWFSPLTELIEAKYDHPESPIGRALQRVREIRVQASSWTPPGIEVTLHLILEAGELPTEYDEIGEVSQELDQWLEGREPRPDEVAARLFPTVGAPSQADRARLWRAFGEALARKCQPKLSAREIPGVGTAVARVVPMVSSEDEFSLSLYRKSEQLDLAHLSSPTPATE